ncbi:hypothetical protein ASPZODRAFT_64696 [Penicilliopsis zonata CBS 506.65]|uniref:FAD/NAD(P)-binding domain-containing protein n=1 Tax=Penicilliopsis zonata CBS 506.65 TaxID=1073090 RepID=A0A1L9SHX8_9EURO|nr:hypothetical protein ASPZODRAFT_64696 [Penicilliopsis zonata CBS 506.65]OJJ46815.1 hypothetical protein ASPZODRAFT_64696 [Penicilliopsis zonata CBS 506.65]
MKILVIGASFAGLHVSHALLKTLPSIKLTLVNPSPTFFFTCSAPRILGQGLFREEEYLIPIQDAFRSYGARFEFVQGTALKIDGGKQTVSIKEMDSQQVQEVPYDYLIITSGSTTPSLSNYVPIPFKQSGEDNMSTLINDAREKIQTASEIVIGGAGPLGVEIAGEIAERAEKDGRAVTISLISATERVLPMLYEKGSRVAEDLLTRKKVKIIRNKRVEEVTVSDGRYTLTLSDGTSLSTALYIPTGGVQPNNAFIPAEFLDENGWVVVDGTMRVQSRENQSQNQNQNLPIFAAGDITNNSPRLVLKAKQQAGVLAANLAAEINGSPLKPKTYHQGDTFIMAVPIGTAGGAGQAFGWTAWSWLVWLIKGRDFFISRAKGFVVN